MQSSGGPNIDEANKIVHVLVTALEVSFIESQQCISTFSVPLVLSLLYIII